MSQAQFLADAFSIWNGNPNDVFDADVLEDESFFDSDSLAFEVTGYACSCRSMAGYFLELPTAVCWRVLKIEPGRIQGPDTAIGLCSESRAALVLVSDAPSTEDQFVRIELSPVGSDPAGWLDERQADIVSEQVAGIRRLMGDVAQLIGWEELMLRLRPDSGETGSIAPASAPDSGGAIKTSSRRNLSVGALVWKQAMDFPFVVRGTVGRVRNELVGSFASKQQALQCVRSVDDGRIIHNVSGLVLWEDGRPTKDLAIYDDAGLLTTG